MTSLQYGEIVAVYTNAGKFLGKGSIVGRNSHRWSDPQHVTVMPEGKHSLKDAWSCWPISLVRRYSPPVDADQPKHIKDFA